jgi:tetratricopeptide (TPR) repeat protein
MYLTARDYHGALRMLDGIDLIYDRNNRGVAYFHLERCEEARDVFVANWHAKRDNLLALAWAARSRLYRGDEPGAIELCQPLAAANAPRFDDALQQLELLFLMQRHQDAWDAFQRAVAQAIGIAMRPSWAVPRCATTPPVPPVGSAMRPRHGASGRKHWR